MYQRFLEAPNTCVTYFSLIQDEKHRDLLCSHIAYADVGWYEISGVFQDILSQLEQSEHSLGETAVVECLRSSYEDALREYET